MVIGRNFYVIILSVLLFCSSAAIYNTAKVSAIIQMPIVSFDPCEKLVCLGETFSIVVTIENLDVNWNMVSAGFHLTTYDCDGELELLSAEEGGFLPSFGEVWHISCCFPPGPCGEMVYGALLLPHPVTGNWPVFPEGSGTLLVCTFLAVAEGNVTYQLMNSSMLMGVELYNPSSELIPHIIACNCSIEVKEATGDLTFDDFIGIEDLVMAGEAFGSNPSHSRWNIWADLNSDSYIGIDDVVLIAGKFGKSI